MATPLTLLAEHACYMSDDDEAQIDELVFEIVSNLVIGEDTPDTADLAKRTCLCGVRIDGFDEYHAHLEDVFQENT